MKTRTSFILDVLCVLLIAVFVTYAIREDRKSAVQLDKIEQAQNKLLEQYRLYTSGEVELPDLMNAAHAEYLAAQQEFAADHRLYLVHFFSDSLSAAVGNEPVERYENFDFGTFKMRDNVVTITVPDYSTFEIRLGDNVQPGDSLFIWTDPYGSPRDYLDFGPYGVPFAFEGRVYTRDYDISWGVRHLDGSYLEKWEWDFE
jgi:hypothetical protein